jgi:biopolymer transport protein ExbD
MSFDWDEKPELNITPLVDVMLVLLAILMITAPVVVYEEKIVLPKGSKSSQVKKNALLEIRIDSDKKIYMKKSTYSFENFSDNFLLISKSYDKKTPVYIRADKNLKYQDVMFILKTVKEAGHLKVSLVTDDG